MKNRFAGLFLLLTIGTAFGLKNSYVPGSVAPPQAWFPLRTADFSFARKVADSLLAAYLVENKVTRNTAQNRLEGNTLILPEIGENISGNRIGEAGTVFLKGQRLGSVTLSGFRLNWCDFYGALIETEYRPKSRFDLDRLYPDALLARGPFLHRVKPLLLKALPSEIAAVRSFFLDMEPPPFDFISDMAIQVYDYPAKSRSRRLVLVNFQAGEGFAPGALYLLDKKGGAYEAVANYFIGEKAELLQTLVEGDDPDPILHAGTYGSGTEYMVVHFNGKEFEVVYKRKEGEFP
jgi:hypothetical protein